ncbi:MAG: Ig-like domain-containing protein [Bacteroidota bacterium]
MKHTGNLWSTGETTQSIVITTAGSYTVKHTAANGCTSADSAPVLVTVNTVPAVEQITGNNIVCSGNTTQLANVTAGGVWTSTNEAVATVDADGLVTALSAGTTTINYAVTNTCGTTTVSALVTSQYSSGG